MQTLPIFQTMHQDVNMMQTRWASILNPIIQLPLNKGLIRQSITLTTGSNTINHLLGRKLQGWFLVRQRAAANIYDDQDNNQSPGITLVLVSDADVTVDIYVF